MDPTIKSLLDAIYLGHTDDVYGLADDVDGLKEEFPEEWQHEVIDYFSRDLDDDRLRNNLDIKFPSGSIRLSDIHQYDWNYSWSGRFVSDMNRTSRLGCDTETTSPEIRKGIVKRFATSIELKRMPEGIREELAQNVLGIFAKYKKYPEVAQQALPLFIKLWEIDEGLFPEDETLALLQVIFEDTETASVALRSEALQTITEVYPQASRGITDPLVEKHKMTDPDTIKAAVTSRAHYSDEENLRLLLTVYKETEDEEIRQSAYDTIALIPNLNELCFNLLPVVLDASLEQVIIDILTDPQNRSAKKYLIRIFKEDLAPNAQLWILHSLPGNTALSVEIARIVFQENRSGELKRLCIVDIKNNFAYLPPRDVKKVVDLALKDEDIYIRKQALQLLPHINEEDTVDQITPFLEDLELELSIDALLALGECQDERSLDIILSYDTMSQPANHATKTQALLKKLLHYNNTIQNPETDLEQAEHAVRQIARIPLPERALSLIKASRLFPELNPLIIPSLRSHMFAIIVHDVQEEVQAEMTPRNLNTPLSLSDKDALYALALFGSEGKRALIKVLEEGPGKEHKKAAARLMAKTEDPTYIPVLIAAMDDPEIKEDVDAALAVYGEKAQAELIRTLKRTSPKIEDEAQTEKMVRMLTLLKKTVGMESANDLIAIGLRFKHNEKVTKAVNKVLISVGKDTVPLASKYIYQEDFPFFPTLAKFGEESTEELVQTLHTAKKADQAKLVPSITRAYKQDNSLTFLRDVLKTILSNPEESEYLVRLVLENSVDLEENSLVEPIKLVLERTEDPTLKIRAIQAIAGNKPTTDQYDIIAQQIKSPHVKVQVAAAETLVQLSPKKTKKVFENKKYHEKDVIALALAKHDPELLIPYIKSHPMALKLPAARALGQTDLSRLKALSEEEGLDTDTTEGIMIVFAELGDDSVLDFLEEKFNGLEGNFKEMDETQRSRYVGMARSIGKLSLARFDQLFRQGGQAQKHILVLAMADLRDPRNLSLLKSALTIPNLELQTDAIKAIARISVPELKALLTHNDPDVVLVAAQELARISLSQLKPYATRLAAKGKALYQENRHDPRWSELYELALKADPDNVKILREYGLMLHYNDEKLERVKEIFKQVLEQTPEDNEIRIHYSELGGDTERLELLETALFYDKNDAMALLYLSIYYYDKMESDSKKQKKALQYCQSVLEQDPDNIVAHYMLAALYYNGYGVERDREIMLYHLFKGFKTDPLLNPHHRPSTKSNFFGTNFSYHPQSASEVFSHHVCTEGYDHAPGQAKICEEYAEIMEQVTITEDDDKE